jgi:hypothetical protein
VSSSWFKIAVLVLALAIPAVAAAQGTQCSLLLRVKLTPDVEHPKDPAFLSTLVGDPAYSLVLVRTSGDSEILRLTGPADSCRSQVDIMRMNAYVIDLQITSANGQG